MKPWGRQAEFLTFFALFFPATGKMASGGPGGGHEPPVAARRGEFCGTEAWTEPPPHLDALGMHSTIRAAALFGRVCRPSYLDTPRRSFVRTSSPVTWVG